MRSSRLEESARECSGLEESARECGRTHQSERCARRAGRDIGLGMSCASPERTSNVERRCRSGRDENYEVIAVGGIGAGVPTQQSKRRARFFLGETAKGGYRIRGGSSMQLPPRMTARGFELLSNFRILVRQIYEVVAVGGIGVGMRSDSTE